MTRPYAPPDIDPVNKDTLAGTFTHVFRKLMQNVNGMLPAQVIQYQPAAGGKPATVQVQPLIMMVDTAGNQTARAQIANVPVVQIGGGGFFLSFPLKTGDLGWIIANDRDISQFLQTYSQAQPNTFRMNDFADSIFLPSVLTGYSINSEDATNAVLQNLDGSVRVSLWPDKIKLSATTIEINGDLVVDGEFTANGMINLVGGVTDINVTGDMFIEGAIQATGSITPDVPPP